MNTVTSALSMALALALLTACSDSGSGATGGDAGAIGLLTGDLSFADGQQTTRETDSMSDGLAAPSGDAAPVSDLNAGDGDTTGALDSSPPPTDTSGGPDVEMDASEDLQVDSKPDSQDAQDAGVEDAATEDVWAEVDAGDDDGCAWTEEDAGGEDAGAGADDGCAWTEEDVADDDACPVDLQQIFIITNANWLLRFEPETLTVVPLGLVNCPAGGATPFSMAVDKEGFAWVLYSNGSLWKVNTGDASCQSTSFVSGQQGFTMFGMGFTADGPTTNTESLFISGGSMSMFLGETGSLGSIALPAMMVTSVSQFPVGPGSPELTGTRFGELWGFFAMSSPSHVSRINKQTAALEKTWPLPNNLQSPEAWAFAHWGGDFYLFFKAQGNVASGAFHLDGLTGVTTEVMPNLGHTITGAGVSICAPTQ